MRFHKAELVFFLLVVLIAIGGWLAWLTYSLAADLMAATSLPSDVALTRMRDLTYFGLVVSAASGVCGVFLVYPLVWRGLREQGELRKMTASLSQRSQTLEYAALTDPLTGMYNRRYFDDALAEYLSAFNDIDKTVGLIVIDIDHFKQVNDTHGHDVGDDVLRAMAACLRQFTRYHDVVARLGGEEFAILSPNVTERQLYQLADRIRTAVSSLTVDAGNIAIRVTVSAGIAVWNGQESGEALCKRADRQLYEAKRKGRNKVCA